MAYELKNMTGIMFENDKGGNDKRPDRRGECCIDGKIYRISGWIRTSQNGKRYMYLAFSAPVATERQVVQEHEQAQRKNKFQEAAERPVVQPYAETDQHFTESDLPF